MRALLAALVVLAAAAVVGQQDQQADLGDTAEYGSLDAGNDDDDVADALKAFDAGYDNTVQGLYKSTVKKEAQPASEWASAHGGFKGSRNLFEKAQEGSDLGQLEAQMDGHPLKKKKKLGEGKKKEKKDHRELGESMDSHAAAKNAKKPKKITLLSDGTTINKHPKGWFSVAQYNAELLASQLDSGDMNRLHNWMHEHRMPSQKLVVDALGKKKKGVKKKHHASTYRLADLNYAHQLGHWKLSYSTWRVKQQNQDMKERKQKLSQRAQERAFVTTADYEHRVLKKKLAPRETHQLEQWLLGNGTPQDTASSSVSLGEGAGVKSEDSHPRFRMADIDHAYKLGEWRAGLKPPTQYLTIDAFNKKRSKKDKFTAKQRVQIALWMQSQSMASRHPKGDLGEAKSTKTGQKKTLKQIHEAFVHRATTAAWRTSDIEYALKRGEWKSMPID